MDLINVNKKSLFLCCWLMMLSGCQCEKTIYFNEVKSHPLSVVQRPATKIHPSEFYFWPLCGTEKYPCDRTQYDHKDYNHLAYYVKKRKNAL